MKMPIVYMQKMSMNECVASTCCYRQVVTPPTYYMEVLSGGSLGSGFVPNTEWKSNIAKEWSKLSYDIDFSGYSGDRPALYYNNNACEWWVLFYDGNTVTSSSSVNEWLDGSSGVSKKNNGCDHKGRHCLYINYALEVKTVHFDATSAHTMAGRSYLEAHEAKQYSS